MRHDGDAPVERDQVLAHDRSAGVGVRLRVGAVEDGLALGVVGALHLGFRQGRANGPAELAEASPGAALDAAAGVAEASPGAVEPAELEGAAEAAPPQPARITVAARARKTARRFAKNMDPPNRSDPGAGAHPERPTVHPAAFRPADPQAGVARAHPARRPGSATVVVALSSTSVRRRCWSPWDQVAPACRPLGRQAPTRGYRRACEGQTTLARPAPIAHGSGLTGGALARGPYAAPGSGMLLGGPVGSEIARLRPVRVMVKRIIFVAIVGGFVLVATTLGYGDPYRVLRRLGLVR